MKSLFVAMAIGAAAFAGGSAAWAAGKAEGQPRIQTGQTTDISARGGHHHWHGYRHHHWRHHGYYRPYYRSYGYYPRPHRHYGGPYGYYGGRRW